MGTKELEKYLDNVYRLEASLYQQNALANAIQIEIYRLKNWSKEEGYEKQSFISSIDIGAKYFFAVAAGFFGGFYIMINWCCSSGYREDRGIFWIIMTILLPFLWGPLCCACLPLFFDYLQWEKTETEKVKNNAAIEVRNEKILRYNQKKIEILSKEMSTLNQYRQETARVLGLYYDRNIIYTKYRNLVAVSSFCEYLQSGRCSLLEGHEGAYNIFENEFRQNIIIKKLDDVVRHLEKIEDNQYMLYSAIQESNRNTRRLSQELMRTAQNLQQIENNTAITAYNSQIVAKNTEFLKWVEIMR